jgi:histidinol phosphatase-like enzyme (inositol monophosphatase family)
MADDPTPRELVEFAVDAAWIAGRLTLEYFQTPVAHEAKADASPVTIADRRAETALREMIAARYPSHAVLGEEFGLSGPDDARYRWILDPIDGTLSFITGVPIYGVMVAVECDGEPVAGVVNMPALGELVAAGRGEGCYWNGRRARVSKTPRLSEALVVCTDVTGMEKFGRGDDYAKVCRASRMQRTWGDCYGHILVATGRADVMLDPIMNIWDTAALRPILEEAGGTFTDWAGNPTHTAPEAVSTNGTLLEEFLTAISSTPAT